LDRRSIVLLALVSVAPLWLSHGGTAFAQTYNGAIEQNRRAAEQAAQDRARADANRADLERQRSQQEMQRRQQEQQEMQRRQQESNRSSSYSSGSATPSYERQQEGNRSSSLSRPGPAPLPSTRIESDEERKLRLEAEARRAREIQDPAAAEKARDQQKREADVRRGQEIYRGFVAQRKMGYFKEEARRRSELSRWRFEPTTGAGSAFNQGEEMWDKTNFKEAAKFYAEAVRRDPQDSRYHYKLGKSFALSGDLLSGIPYLQNAVALAPLNGGWRMELAEALANNGQWIEAEIEADHAVFVMPSMEKERNKLLARISATK